MWALIARMQELATQRAMAQKMVSAGKVPVNFPMATETMMLRGHAETPLLVWAHAQVLAANVGEQVNG